MPRATRKKKGEAGIISGSPRVKDGECLSLFILT